MSEFLMLSWNVAIPEVDRGDDIFVVKDDNGDLRRVQAKSAQSQLLKNGYYAQFSLPRLQLITPISPEIYFLLLIRHENSWRDLFVISRAELSDIIADKLNSGIDNHVTLRLSVKSDQVSYGDIDFSVYRHLKKVFPQINH